MFVHISNISKSMYVYGCVFIQYIQIHVCVWLCIYPISMYMLLNISNIHVIVCLCIYIQNIMCMVVFVSNIYKSMYVYGCVCIQYIQSHVCESLCIHPIYTKPVCVCLCIYLIYPNPCMCMFAHISNISNSMYVYGCVFIQYLHVYVAEYI